MVVYETCTERTRRHTDRTAEQCAQHGSEGVEGRLAEEGSTAQARQRKEAGHEEMRFLTPDNLSRLLYLRVLAAICSKSLIITFVLRI
jgi:hypothetical protein